MAQIRELDGPSLAPEGDEPARQLVILLHGVGADGQDLIGLASYYRDVLPYAAFVAPNAPEQFDMAPFGYQWFSIADLQANTRLDGVRAVAPLVDEFIDEQLTEYGLNEDALVLVGFSQGAMVALHVGLRREPAVAGIIAHSGMLVGEHLLAEEIRAKPPVLLTHGAFDDVMPVQALPLAKAALKAEGVPVAAHVMPGLGHGIDEATLQLDRRFLAELFP